MVGGTRRDSRPRRHEAALWLIRVSTGATVVAAIVFEDIGDYGFERNGAWGLSAPMSLAILLCGVLMSVPFALVEGIFARRNSRAWVQILCAVLGAAVIGWWASLPVGLRFFGSRDPVEQTEVEMTMSSFLLMGLPYVLLLVVCRRSKRGNTDRRRP
jgi:hypothetical protein